jgi:hypothetical protein
VSVLVSVLVLGLVLVWAGEVVGGGLPATGPALVLVTLMMLGMCQASPCCSSSWMARTGTTPLPPCLTSVHGLPCLTPVQVWVLVRVLVVMAMLMLELMRVMLLTVLVTVLKLVLVLVLVPPLLIVPLLRWPVACNREPSTSRRCTKPPQRRRGSPLNTTDTFTATILPQVLPMAAVELVVAVPVVLLVLLV